MTVSVTARAPSYCRLEALEDSWMNGWIPAVVFFRVTCTIQLVVPWRPFGCIRGWDYHAPITEE